MKAVFSDLDETLLVNWHVPEINNQAIQTIRKQGHKFIPCSGRPPFMMEEILKELQIYDCEQEYYVSFNGGMLLEAKDNRVLYYIGLTLEDAKLLCEIAEKYQLCVMIVTNECFHILNPIASEIDRKTRQKTPFQQYSHYHISRIPSLEKENIGKVMFVKDNGIEYFRQITGELPQKIRDTFEISYSSGRFMEFNKKGVSKGNALRFLAEYLNIDRKDTIAIGDSYNDLSMILEAGIGACVSSAEEEIRAQSDLICERDYTEGAVAEVIRRCFEIE